MAPIVFFAALLASFTASVAAVSDVHCSPAGKKLTVSWSSDASDSYVYLPSPYLSFPVLNCSMYYRAPVSLALMSSTSPDVIYPGGLVLADNVDPKDNSITVHLPEVNPGSYIISLRSTSKRARSPGPLLASSPAFHIAARQASASSSKAQSSHSTTPAASRSASQLSASISSVASSITAAASSQLSSLSSVASAGASNISSIASTASSATSSPSGSSSGSGSAGVSVRLLGPGVGVAVAAVLGGMVLGAAML
ncbi:hypothetical protein C8F01DRAFT_676367 [Mycena amicta]|nr:hypothetical protein C8F01DRAFT_676367 [Mycena amicta]